MIREWKQLCMLWLIAKIGRYLAFAILIYGFGVVEPFIVLDFYLEADRKLLSLGFEYDRTKRWLIVGRHG